MTREKHDPEEPLAEQVFVEGVIARGEAASPVDGQLPAGATHEILDDDQDGAVPKIRRTRFKTF
jgi:hypothetical protein